MQQKSKKNADMNVNRAYLYNNPAPKADMKIFRELDDYWNAQHQERLRNPPKSDYVMPSGKLLPVPAKLLASENDVMGMYEHLHWFCHNTTINKKTIKTTMKI